MLQRLSEPVFFTELFPRGSAVPLFPELVPQNPRAILLLIGESFPTCSAVLTYASFKWASFLEDFSESLIY